MAGEGFLGKGSNIGPRRMKHHGWRTCVFEVAIGFGMGERRDEMAEISTDPLIMDGDQAGKDGLWKPRDFSFRDLD